MSDVDGDWIERQTSLALDFPLPDQLYDELSAEIEQHTLNLGIKHRDVFEGVQIAYPVILRFLQQYPRYLDKVVPE